MGLMDLLQQALNGNNHANAEAHFDEVAREAPRDQMADGLAATMRSNDTPPFAEMVSKMFGQSTPGQQAGLLNQILTALGPVAATALAGGALGKILPVGQSQVTPEQAAKLSPEQVSAIAGEAERTQPGVVDQVSQFYAEHSSLIKVLGGAALAVALAKMKNNMDNPR